VETHVVKEDDLSSGVENVLSLRAEHAGPPTNNDDLSGEISGIRIRGASVVFDGDVCGGKSDGIRSGRVDSELRVEMDEGSV